MYLTLLFGLITLAGLLLALPKSRKWILLKFRFLGQDEKLSTGAEIFVYRRDQGIYHLADIYNAGPEDIIDLKVTIYWENNKEKQSREIHGFLDNGVDPMWATPHECNILEKEKRILIPDFPFKNYQGHIDVNIKGKTQITKKELDITRQV